MKAIAQLTCLIIDAQHASRSVLRSMLAQLGIPALDEAASANVGLKRLMERRYDLIVCEYHLGDGQDGQHLLEDARQHQLLPPATLFIMLTGEAAYDRVVSAAEFAPSDYILKPFSSDTLRERIVRAIAKREVFAPAYRELESSNLQAAIRICAAGAEQHPEYLFDFLRLKGELLLTVGSAAAAQSVYSRVIESKAVPWAQLGLAKALFAEQRYAEAEQTLEALIADRRHYVDAFDWLARVREARGDADGAMHAIREAIMVSPHAMRRLRRLGEMAMETGDADAAEAPLAEVVRKGKYSVFGDPEDHVLLAKAQIGRGDRTAAERTIRDLEASMRGVKKTPVCAAFAAALVYDHAGETDKARIALERAIAANGAEAGLSERAVLDLAANCLAHAMDDHAGRLVHEVMRNAADGRVVERAKSILAQAGKAELGEELEQRTRAEVKELITTGAMKAQSGDFAGAVEYMLAAATKLPGNAQVAFNAALALLKHLEHHGWDESIAARASAFMEQVRRRDPSQGRLAALCAYYDKLLSKYGIKPGMQRPTA